MVTYLKYLVVLISPSVLQSRYFVHICCHFSPPSFSQQLSQGINVTSRDNLFQLKQTSNYCLYFTKVAFILYFSAITWPS